MVIQCRNCDKTCEYQPDETQWDFGGYGYDTEYVVCPECGRINIVKYVFHDNFDINNDERWYKY